MRFASREKAILSQWEVGAGLVPGGGPMAGPLRFIGRGRALEVLLGADDVDGDLAELQGYVNRSLPDSELTNFVDNLATATTPDALKTKPLTRLPLHVSGRGRQRFVQRLTLKYGQYLRPIVPFSQF
jgi:enoyl-CoA hydratase/carnithine racemase